MLHGIGEMAIAIPGMTAATCLVDGFRHGEIRV